LIYTVYFWFALVVFFCSYQFFLEISPRHDRCQISAVIVCSDLIAISCLTVYATHEFNIDLWTRLSRRSSECTMTEESDWPIDLNSQAVDWKHLVTWQSWDSCHQEGIELPPSQQGFAIVLDGWWYDELSSVANNILEMTINNWCQ
jgi:hypothetical protein